MVKIEASWGKVLADEFEKPYFKSLTEFVRNEYHQGPCYPPGRQIFAAFDLCPFDKVKVVIIGQDPYHEPGQAEGLCFSVAQGVTPPPSLVNIFKEIEDDLGTPPPPDGSLRRWAEQGVLLLNTVLTVRAHAANSHKGKGWEEFTDGIIKKISDGRDNVVFLLWGGNARAKKPLIDGTRHLVLECAHPSPLSAYNGFFGCGHFIKANEYLLNHGKTPVIWSRL